MSGLDPRQHRIMQREAFDLPIEGGKGLRPRPIMPLECLCSFIDGIQFKTGRCVSGSVLTGCGTRHGTALRPEHRCVCRKLDSAILMVETAKDRT
jgi:hypothetical protein